MSLNIVSLNKKLSFSSSYFVSSEHSFVKLINSRSYFDDLIDWFIDESDDEEANNSEINDQDEVDDEDETNDEYSINRL
jgi:uncharacterized membrane protein required for colicin V production